MGSVVKITSEDDFNEKVKNAGSKIVIVDFSATWCGPCKMIGPEFKRLAEAHADIVALCVDVDEVEEVAAKYKIEAMPTFLVLKNDQEVGRMMGADKGKLGALFTATY